MGGSPGGAQEQPALKVCLQHKPPLQILNGLPRGFRPCKRNDFRCWCRSVLSRLLLAGELQIQGNVATLFLKKRMSFADLVCFPWLLTSDEAQFLLWVETGQMSLISLALGLSIIPVAHGLSHKLIAEVPVQQIPMVAVGIWNRQGRRY